MTESSNVPQNECNGKLTQLSVEFLKFIKISYDQGKSLYIRDFMDHFNYSKHQIVSKYLDKLEDKQFIESNWKDGKRVINITPKGLDYIYTLGCSYFSEIERLLIHRLRREGGIKASMGTISNIITEFTRNTAPDQDNLIKDIILREFGKDIVPESSLNNICKKIRRVRAESGRDFIENYKHKETSS